MRNRVHCSLIAASLVAALLVGISAEAAEESEEEGGGEARFAVGLSYIDGILDVSDFISDSFEDAGYDVDSLTIPVGLSLAGGYQFGFGGEIMVEVGPFSMMYIDVINGPYSGDYFNWELPVGITAGYALFSDKSVSPLCSGWNSTSLCRW
jgi:hypothetical protein